MEAVTLSDLWPIIAAVLAPMLLCVTALARYQHVDNTKIRDLIEKTNKETRDENRDLISESNTENRKLIEKNRDLIGANHAELSGSLADARERLARIEGYLRISPPPQQGDGDAKAA